MLIVKSNYKMIVLGLLLTFISPQTMLYDKGWEEFNYKQATYVHQEWYEKVENTFKETSVTGKGPLWAQVATSIACTKAKRGEPMVGFKMKL